MAKAYRLLKTILNTAVADGVLPRNRCLLRGAGSERAPERVAPTLLEAHALAAAIQPRWRMLVLLATWSGLRWDELVALRRSSVDLEHGRVTVTAQLVETAGGVRLGPPKTDAGRRAVHLPPHLLPELADHLRHWVGTEQDAWLFCGLLGAPLVRRNFTVHWTKAVPRPDSKRSGSTICVTSRQHWPPPLERPRAKCRLIPPCPGLANKRRRIDKRPRETAAVAVHAEGAQTATPPRDLAAARCCARCQPSGRP